MNFSKVPPEKLELYSSATTLSDMEIFIFPELMYSLMLANIMSPCLWAWREDAWFRRYEKKSPYRRIQRLKQYIIDHYEFNLDLDTWGLTTQERELERFERFMDRDTLSHSNALFGYEGDRYYFDLDIRRHFGLDHYEGNVIPYWKTETIEAMNAFARKTNYSGGAGECVSLAALYAAALFVVCQIPLEDIFLMATPLHSQNFVTIGDGILTNNRRIVTRPMWFNGTELTAKAQRALRNEQVTIVSHHTGCVHVLYPDADIAPSSYERFSKNLRTFLKTKVDFTILVNFLREHRELQGCFQFRHEYHGRNRYLKLETAFHYEHGSPCHLHDASRDKLLSDIDEYEFYSDPIEGRISLNCFDEFLQDEALDLDCPEHVSKLVERFNCQNNKAEEIILMLREFTSTEPRLPDFEHKNKSCGEAIPLTPDMSREEVITTLEGLRQRQVVDLAFYAFRDLARTDPAPFLKAAIERNPVCIEGAAKLERTEIIGLLSAMSDESIYEGSRLAQPDEVWNFSAGDGLEKALVLACILHARAPDTALQLHCADGLARLCGDDFEQVWPTAKPLELNYSMGCRPKG